MNKAKNRASSRGSQETTSSQLLPRSDLIAASSATSPIAGPKDARNWIESKGYILSGERYTKPKLADILLTVVIDSKVPAEAKSAILVVAFLIEDLAEEDFVTSIADKIIDKIDGALSNLNSEVDNTKKFLTATSAQQAEATLVFQKAVDAFSGKIDKLTQASDKAAESMGNHQRSLSDMDWPQLETGNASQTAHTNPLNPRSFSLTTSQAKIQQCNFI